MFYSRIIKPLLFLVDPEKAHHFSVRSFSIILGIPLIGHLVRSLFSFEHPGLHRQIWGLDFPNPVGLAAGFDKDGKHFRTMSALGFGFIEIGTVTPLPQEGNPKKRLFRLPEDEALINRMGFNNEGVRTMVERLKKSRHSPLIIGGNIGKNKLTPNDKAVEDYEISFKALYPYVDYFVVNVSSPNTPGLRELQDKEPLTHLLKTLIVQRDKQEKKKPICLKIAPDLTEGQLEDILEIIDTLSLDGIVVSNTTIHRDSLKTSDQTLQDIGSGGLSGRPLRLRARNLVRIIRERHARIPIIGVGGISSPEDAVEMLKAGASLLQVYTGLIYQGPSFIKSIKKHIVRTI